MEDTHYLQRLWNFGETRFSLADTNLAGAAGLSPVGFELVRKRGAIDGSEGEDELVNSLARKELIHYFCSTPYLPRQKYTEK